MKTLVVLDKSYVCGASTIDVREVCDNFRAVMPEDLFFELVSGDLDTRTKCFRKFPQRDNPVDLVPNVASLVQFEKEARHPSSPLEERRVQMVFKFNERLASGELELTETQARTIALWKDELAKDTDLFEERATSADRLFPDLRGIRPGQKKEVVADLVKKVATDLEGLREVYSSLAPTDFPPSPIVGRSWAVLRRLQVHFIGAIEYFSSYGAGINKTNRAKLENEVTDLNYLVLACLAGGLATRDETIARRFALLCPQGILIK